MHHLYLTAHVKEALAVDPRVAVQDLDVEVRHDVVHVRGEVDSERTRLAVEEILRELPEVGSFVNHTRPRILKRPAHEHVGPAPGAL